MKLLDITQHLNTNAIDTGNMSRRQSLAAFGKLGKKLTLAGMPTALLMALPNMGQAANTDVIIDTLNRALKLKYLTDEYYRIGLNLGVVPNNDLSIFRQVSKHEAAHVALLQDAISKLGATPISKPTFDFTAGGQFTPFTNYVQFLALAQAFEDMGVRAYKGQLGNLIGSKDLLTTVLQIHSVEARHAAEVRRVRSEKGWITGSSYGTLPLVIAAVYAGEDNTTQGGIDVTALTTVGIDAISEAFDEPLNDTDITTIINQFII